MPKKKENKPEGKWFTVTFKKGKIPKTFFPTNIFPEYIGKRLTYQEANEKPDEFWKDKNIVFHFADRSLAEYKKSYERIITNSQICFSKFACITGATDMTHYDNNKDRPIFAHYKMMYDLSKNFLWELPLNYNMFYGDINAVPLTLYDDYFEEEIQEKNIDFLLLMDNVIFYNYVKTLEIGQKLKAEGYNVIGLLIDSEPAKLYHNKLTFKTILNTKNNVGQKKFYDLLKRSKIMLDLNLRWTYGRSIYESLFKGCICIGSSTYGAMYHLFPDLIIDAFNFNMQKTKEFCVETLKKWAPDLVTKYRNRAKEVASPESFAKRLDEATKKILNGEKYSCNGF